MKLRLRRSLFKSPHLWVGLAYIGFIIYYMGPSTWNCTQTVYGFGDNTAGMIWRYFATPAAPLGGFENLTNFPVGESTYNPALASASSQFGIYWLFAKIAGPICGYNFLNFLGFFTAAFAMYLFTMWLVRNRWIAFLAGYAVAFTPYFQVKIGGHPSYGYQVLFILLFWLALKILQKPQKRYAVGLGVLAGLSAYFDPYFILLSAVLLGPLLLFWTAYSVWRYKRHKNTKPIIWAQFKSFVVAGFAMAITLVPILGIYIDKNSEIKGYVGGLRGNVLLEAKACSNYPQEYALPFAIHPLGKELIGEERFPRIVDNLHKKMTCGIGEDSVGISLTIIMVTLAGLGTLIWTGRLFNYKKNNDDLPLRPIILVSLLVAIGLFAAWMALPPVKKFGIPTGSYLLLDITLTWRTIARLYVVINIIAVTLFSICLLFFKKYLGEKRKLLSKVLYVLVFAAIFVEYQAFPMFKGNSLGTFNYQKDANQTYYWLRDNEDISVVAEYPLERFGQESDIMTYYLTMQWIHRKPILNSLIPTSPEEINRSGIKDLSDPQTLPALKSLGIDTVIIHGVTAEELKKTLAGKLEVIHDDQNQQSIANRLPSNSAAKNDRMVVARIIGSPKSNNVQIGIKGNVANATLGRSSINWEYEVVQNTELILLKDLLKPEYKTNVYKADEVCFDIKLSAEGDSGSVTFVGGNGAVLGQLQLTDEYQSVRLKAVNSSIKLSEKNGHNMRLRNLGCVN